MTLQQLNEAGYSQTEKELKKFYGMMSKEYKTALDNIRAELQGIYNKITGDRSPAQVAALLKDNPAWLFTEAMKFDRLTGLQRSIQTEYMAASIKAANMTVEASKLAITNSFYKQRYALTFASPVKLSFAVLNPKVVEISVLGSPKVWKGIAKAAKEAAEKKYGDLTKYQAKHGTLTDVILSNRQKDLQKIQSVITQNLIQGKGYGSAAKEVKAILNTTASNAARIVRTESARNMNAGAYASHRTAQAQGLDVKRQILSVLDDRTRQQSQEVDTRFEDDDGFFHYPGGLLVDYPGNSGVAAYDINDRETVIEVVDGQSSDQRRGRNPETGKNEVMDFKDYESWAKSNGMRQNASGRWVYKG